jgi:hypothetical protein
MLVVFLNPHIRPRVYRDIRHRQKRGNGMQQPRRARPPAALPGDAAPPPADGGTADLDAYIATVIDAAPPLTPGQRDQLALILRRTRPPCPAQATPQPQPPGPAPARPGRPRAERP